MLLSSKRFNSFLCVIGLMLIVVGWGGSWGSAYGQTAGPTPTSGGVVNPISVIKSVTPASGVPNDILTFSIQVRNNDTVEQTNVVFTDRILDFLEVISASSTKGTATVNGQDVRVDIGTLQPGETVTVTITVRIRPATQAGSSGVNIASVTAVGPTGSGTTNSNPVAISVGQAPPGQLPDTGEPARSNPWMIGGGLLILMLGGSLLLGQRRRVSR